MCGSALGRFCAPSEKPPPLRLHCTGVPVCALRAPFGVRPRYHASSMSSALLCTIPLTNHETLILSGNWLEATLQLAGCSPLAASGSSPDVASPCESWRAGRSLQASSWCGTREHHGALLGLAAGHELHHQALRSGPPLAWPLLCQPGVATVWGAWVKWAFSLRRVLQGKGGASQSIQYSGQ